MLRLTPILISLLVLGCTDDVTPTDAGMDSGPATMMDGMMPPMDGMMPRPMDGMMPPPMDGMMPPPMDGMMPPPDGMMPPPTDGMTPASDGGTCELVPPMASPPRACCYEDDDCPTGMMGMQLRCYDATCASDGLGSCVPPPPPTGGCFGDLDCAAGETCIGGSIGCADCTDTTCSLRPMLGSCG